MSVEPTNFEEDVSTFSSIEPFWARVLLELERFGVTSLMYGAIATKGELSFGTRTSSMIWKTNHDSAFFKRFGAEGRDDFIDNCLTFEHCLTKTTPFIWHDPSSWEKATSAQLEHAQTAIELGLHVGFTLPTTYFANDRLGAISVAAGNHTPLSFNMMWESQRDNLFKILDILDNQMREKYLAQVINLSPREKEVLQWLAAGLRPKQVAEKMQIGYRTVDKYIISAKTKLKAKSRDQAIAKAMIFNVI